MIQSNFLVRGTRSEGLLIEYYPLRLSDIKQKHHLVTHKTFAELAHEVCSRFFLYPKPGMIVIQFGEFLYMHYVPSADRPCNRGLFPFF